MEPVRGFSKIAWDAKLLPTTVLAYSVDCVDFCHLLKIQDYCLCPNGTACGCPSSPSTHPFIHATYDITVVVKK